MKRDYISSRERINSVMNGSCRIDPIDDPYITKQEDRRATLLWGALLVTCLAVLFVVFLFLPEAA